MNDDLDGAVRILSCGCMLVTRYEQERPVFQMIPCHLDCINLHNALRLANDADLPIEYRQSP